MYTSGQTVPRSGRPSVYAVVAAEDECEGKKINCNVKLKFENNVSCINFNKYGSLIKWLPVRLAALIYVGPSNAAGTFAAFSASLLISRARHFYFTSSFSDATTFNSQRRKIYQETRKKKKKRILTAQQKIRWKVVHLRFIRITSMRAEDTNEKKIWIIIFRVVLRVLHERDFIFTGVLP